MTFLEKILERVKAKLAGAGNNQAEIWVERHEGLKTQAREGVTDSFGQSQETGVALRLARDGRIGFAYTTDLSNRALETMVRQATESAVLTEAETAQNLPAPQALADGANWPDCDPTLSRRSVTEKIHLSLELERLAKEYDPRVKRVRGATYRDEQSTVLLWNEAMGTVGYERSLCELQVMVMAVEGESQESAWEMDFSPHFEKLDVKRTAHEAAREAVGLLHAKPLKTGQYPAILHHGVVAACLGILAPSFLAESIQKKKSALAGRTGEVIYAPTVTLIDDGLYPAGYDSSPFDGEGLASQTTAVVADGVLKNFLYDSHTASLEKTHSTGNSVRQGIKEIPRPGTRNFYLRSGDRELADLRRDLARGVEICDVIGIHTANAITGDFSVGAAGYHIEGGERASPVRGFAISGNLHDMLRSVATVGSDLKFYGSIGAPSVLIAALDVGGT